MVSRLMLNLRSATIRNPHRYNSTDVGGLSYLPSVGTVHTARYDFIDTVIGNLGQEVFYGEDEDDSAHSPDTLDVSDSNEIEMSEEMAVREEKDSTALASDGKSGP